MGFFPMRKNSCDLNKRLFVCSQNKYLYRYQIISKLNDFCDLNTMFIDLKG